MDKSNVIKNAIDVIDLQAKTIDQLKNYIDYSFVEIISVLKNMKGHLVVIGIGKSAIIGRKIVATLNSTGTPSVFIHAVEALHGDLGNIKESDVVLFISKSGNTEELKKILSILKSQKNITISMSSNKNSFLSKNTDYFLNSYIEKEACPNNLAPTTSTTAQLVLGDALAICLLKLKGFTKDDFARFHPAGVLGKKVTLKVSDVYNSDLKPQVKLDDSLHDVVFEISSKRMGAVCVVEKNKVLGIITDGDLRRFLQKNNNIMTSKAKDLMVENPKVIMESELAFKALNIMKNNNITQLLVLKKNKYDGIIHLHDILKEEII
ncbi:MAG: KpsF/GutQ family sugar-phosphate isomerase [Bacteroidota bacterium]|nr:KpsF/GutQ family sugar-phosphate isomerase [Bacteroidota bacterium]